LVGSGNAIVGEAFALDVLGERAPNLSADGAVAQRGQARNGSGQLGLDTSADVDEVRAVNLCHVF